MRWKQVLPRVVVIVAGHATRAVQEIISLEVVQGTITNENSITKSRKTSNRHLSRSTADGYIYRDLNVGQIVMGVTEIQELVKVGIKQNTKDNGLYVRLYL
ncbi:hypothetical protein DPMN_110469 [Dreissena polymorpha]|uniref:Uncharacterized protein n=1 Tax=Dreissena polymorpha TaxID=45954 RepID=A0A9D4QMY3_DREPO|nr:hypothetical protein DPMN_110469 [Dreissena polymorpha]